MSIEFHKPFGHVASPVQCRVADSWLLHPIQEQRAQTLCDDSGVHPTSLTRCLRVFIRLIMQTIRGIQDTILIAEASPVPGVRVTDVCLVP